MPRSDGIQLAIAVLMGIGIGFLAGGWIAAEQCRKEVTISFRTMVVDPAPAGNPASQEERETR